MDQSDQPEMEPPVTIPKLSLFSLPSQLSEPSDTATPPHPASASVPFLWEEAPGKPRLGTRTEVESAGDDESVIRSLGLPPRLLTEVKFTNMPSPTTVLYGPEMGRSLSFTFSFRTPSESRRLTREKFGYFGSTRWGSFRKNNKAVVGASFEFSSSVNGGTGHDDDDYDHGKVKITRVRRRGSLLNLSNTKSHLLVSYSKRHYFLVFRKL